MLPEVTSELPPLDIQNSSVCGVQKKSKQIIMSTNCLLPKHFPKFPVKSPCSSTILSIKEISRPLLSVYLSDLGCILQDFENFHNLNEMFICGNHLSELKNRYYNRQRAVHCKIPICLSSHTNAQKHERLLNEEQVRHIFQSTGIVLPIGTGK